MIELYNSQITEIIPVNLTNPEVEALSYAINKAIKKNLDFAEKTKIYCNIEKQTDEILDYLAVELNSQYYSENMNLETKRKVINETIVWYQYAGTRYAVEKLISTVFGSGEVIEWYDYSGQPGHFKISTENYNITTADLEKFNSIIAKVKRKSAILDALEITLKAYMNYHSGTVVHIGEYFMLKQEG